MKLLFILISLVLAVCCSALGQNFTEILGRPTNSAVTISFLSDEQTEVYWEYGTSPEIYSNPTSVFVAEKDTPLEVEITGLLADTKYFYRTRYRTNGATTSFLTGTGHFFHTQRAKGSTFTFAVEADPHLDTNSNTAAYTLTLQNILSKNPDFLLDLGDIFMSEKLPVINQTEITNRHLLYRPFFNNVCHSVPLFLALGNHEGEAGWLLDGTSASIPVMTTNTRKLYYPNPVPNSFYSGDTVPEKFVGFREDYYSWEWGDALIIVLDPYWHTVTRPDWGWTLGKEQYDWFKKTISSSKAKNKFVFCHHLVGGKGNDTRGGTEFAGLFEMGGQNADSTWGFDTYRPGWGKPIHQLMVENNTTIFFHGHDHFYAKQEKDGVVYQEVPQPSNKNITNTAASKYGYVDGVFLPGRGYLLVTVTDSNTKVEYIRAYLPNEETASHKNGEVAHSYTISSFTNGVEEGGMQKDGFLLNQNYPNPFGRQTFITYSLMAAGQVLLKVYDVFGREIATLADEYQQPGTYSVSVNSGEISPRGGIYFCRMSFGNYSKTLKMICSNQF